MKTIACLVLAVSAVAFAQPTPASAASFGGLSLKGENIAEQAAYRGRRCRVTKRITYRNGVRRVKTVRVCRRGW